MSKHVKNALKVVATFIVVAAISAIFGPNAFLKNFFAIATKRQLAATFAMAFIGSIRSKGIEAVSANYGAKFAARSATAPRQLVYGECRVGGTIAHMSTTGTDNHLLHMVVVLAGHEVESLQSVRLNDVDLSTSDNTINGVTVKRATNSTFTNSENANAFTGGSLVRYRFNDGSQTSVDPFMDAQLSSIGTNDKFQSCAFLYIQMVFDQEKFGGGMPTVSCVIRGKKVYDPRTGNTAWSNNSALCVRDYISDTTYGLKALSTEINDATSAGGFAAAANICDQDVVLADNSTTEKRYTANGFTNFSATGSGVIEGLLTSMAGQLTYTNGKFNLFAGAAQTPSLTISDDNILQPITVNTKPQNGELYNTVKPSFIDASNSFVAADAPVYQDATFLTQDTPNGVANDKPNYVKKLEIMLPFTTTHTRAQRLGRISLNAQRQTTTLSVLVNLEFLKLQPNDWVYLTNERLSYSSKVFEILDVDLEVIDAKDTEILACRLTLKETSSSIFTFAHTDYQTAVASGSDLSAGGISLAAPSGLSVANDTMGVDILTHASITVSWTNASTPYILGTEVQFKRSGDSVYTTNFANAGATKQQITGLEVGVTYNIRVRHLGLNTGSSYVTTNHTVGGTAIAANSLKNDQITVNTTSGILENIGTSNVVVNNTKVDYSSDGVNTLPSNKGGTGITNFANSTHLNSNTTKSDVGLGNVDNESSATIRGQTTSGNHTGTVGGTSNSTIVAGSSRAAAVLDSSNRFTGSILHSGTVRTAEQLIDAHERATNAIDSSNRITGSIFDGTNTRTPANINDAYVRATTGLNASGVVQVAVPSAQISGALTTVLTASPTNTAQWTTNDGAIYSPTGTNFDITVTADNGINSETCVIRWSYVNVSNSNADYISACTEQTDSSNAFTLGSITDLSGNNVKFATCVVTHTASSTTITLQALLSQIHVSGGGK